MIYVDIEYSNQELFEELRSQAMEERIGDIYQYKELVEGLIEEKRRYGLLEDEDNLPQTVKNLMLRWPEVEEMLVKNKVL